MPKFIPDQPADFNNSTGEAQVFRALEKLPERFTVLHSFRWVVDGSGPPRAGAPFGESDFLIFDPDRGILVIEVKSGLVRLDGGQWFQANRKIDDPEKQAARSVFYLKDLLDQRLRRPELCRVFHAVWFPSRPFPKHNLPPNYSPEFLFDSTSLEDPTKAVNSAFNFWEKRVGKSCLSTVAQKRVIEMLAPKTEPAGIALPSRPVAPAKPAAPASVVVKSGQLGVGAAGVQRGVLFFRHLAKQANHGKAVGIAYGDFIAFLHEKGSFREVAGRDYRPSDTPVVIELAWSITRANGGRIAVTAGGRTIQSGMDTFIWALKPPHDRPERAWHNPKCPLPYSRADWKAVFPDGLRRLVKPDELARLP